MIDLDARREDPRSGSPSFSRREMLGLLATTGAGAMLAPIIRSGAVLAAETPKKGGQIVVALSQEPTVFNPNRPHIEVDRGVHFGLFDSLWRVDEKAQFLPNLAVEVPTVKNGGIQKNGLEYLVKLRKGVKWHDGKPFTSKDVKFTHELITNPKFGAYSKVGHDQVASIETPDESTVRIRLKEPFAPFMTAWRAWPIPTPPNSTPRARWARGRSGSAPAWPATTSSSWPIPRTIWERPPSSE
jgi:peptide/nickel transport system substrate-binding protein